MTIGYGPWAFVVLGVVGAVTLLLARKWSFYVLSALVLGVAFRDFATRWMNVHTSLDVSQVTAIGRWWFAVVLTLLLIYSVRWLRFAMREGWLPRLQISDWLLGLVIIMASVATLLAPNPSLAFTSFRGYFQPIGVFLLARMISPSQHEIRRVLIIWFALGILMATFGIWQSIAWSPEDFRAEGYVRQDGQLVVTDRQIAGVTLMRPASTVSGPNELGVDLVIMFVMAVVALASVKGGLRNLTLGIALIFTAGLALTGSRSALLAFLAASAVLLLLLLPSLRDTCKLKGRSRRQPLFLMALLVSVATILIATAFSGLISKTIDTLQQQYHYIDTVEAIQYLIEHPQGAGMGNVEPKGAFPLISSESSYHVEGSIFQIAIEMGIWGLAAWLAFWTATLVRIWRNFHSLDTPELRIVTGAAIAAWLGSMVAFLFLPLMQSISLMIWLWFLLGIAYQSTSIEASWDSTQTSVPVQ